MRLKVSHETVYRFETPQRSVLQSHRLTPSEFQGQRVVDWAVDVPEGAAYGAQFRDGAGDQTGTLRVGGPVEEMSVRVHGMVETVDLAGVLRGHREKVPPQAYIRATRVTRPDLAIEELAARAIGALGGASALDRAHALAGAVTEALTFTSGSTNAQSTAAEALAGGQGVCQDFTHVLIAAAIAEDIPARYVAGYLFPGENEAQGQSQSQSQGQSQSQTQGQIAEGPMGTENQASHAWAELFIDGLGWVGFDPSNECCPDARYIRLCSGYDAFDAAPIRGLSSGTGAETLKVDVAVTQEQQ